MWSASTRASITLHNFVVYGKLKVKLAGIFSHKPLQALPRQMGWSNNRKRRAVHINLERELGRALTKKADEVGATTKKEV
jgi:hypothetical protein